MRRINEYCAWQPTPELEELDRTIDALFKKCESPEEIVELSTILHSIVNGAYTERALLYGVAKRKAASVMKRLFTLEEWHKDIGPVLWWKLPVEEPPYYGTPLDSSWPNCHTHWAKLEDVPPFL